MTSPAPLMQILAWSLLHFLWQGAAIAALAGACMLAMRKPAGRYLVGIGALALMIASFAITFTLLGDAAGVAAESSSARAPAAVPASPPEARGSFVEPTTDEPAAISQDAEFLWIARGWLAGVSVFALRVAFGLLLLAHLRRRNLVALPPELIARFEALQRRLGIRRAIRFCECNLLRVPAVIGLLRPVVLLPMRALTGLSPEQLESVVAHELGHVRRFDVAVNFFQVVAETLFFFHPAVWWLNRRIRADREDCCDDVAIAACGSTAGYARALATMETWRDVPAFAMAANGSPVAARVARLLGARPQSGGSRAAGAVTATLVFATALAAGAMSIANPAIAQTADSPIQLLVEQAEAAAAAAAPPDIPVELPVPPAAPPDVPVPPVAPAVSPEKPEAPVAPVHRPKPLPPALPAPPLPPQPAREAAPARGPAPPREPAASLEPTRSHYKFADADNLASVDAVLALSDQDVSADYIRGIRASGFNPTVSELIALRSEDVSPEYVQGMRSNGFNPSVSELIALHEQDVSPEFVQGMRTSTMNPSVSELIALHEQDVSPELRDELASAGYRLGVPELIEARVMDISPEFIEQAAEHGFRNPTFSKLVELKNADSF